MTTDSGGDGPDLLFASAGHVGAHQLVGPGLAAAWPGRSPRRSGDGYGPVGVDEGPVASFHLRAAGWSRAERTASVPLLVPVTFLGEGQDVSDPDTAVLAVGKAAELQHAVGQEAVHELAAHA